MPVLPNWTWISHPDLLWVPGRHVGDGIYEILDGNMTLYRPTETAGHIGCIEENYDDLALVIGEFADRDVLHHIRRRYERDICHSWIGPVLIAVNPRRPMPFYTSGFAAETIKRYQQRRNDPHPFTVAARALDSLLLQKRSQWILAVGLPTSGRHHLNRVVVQYLSQFDGKSGDPFSERIGLNTLKAIEILRSFIEISIENYRASQISMYLWFDNDGTLVQTEFQPCWIVLHRSSSKSSPTFDILDYLEKGSDAELQKELGIPNNLKTVSDVSGFETILLYFSDLGINPQSSCALLQLLACVLRLRRWRPQVNINEEIKSIFHLLNMNINSVTTDGISICENRLTCFIENLYAIAFRWVCQKLNQCLEPKNGAKSSWNYIAIPDIFAFQSEDDLLIQTLSAFRQTQLQGLFYKTYIQNNIHLLLESGIAANDAVCSNSAIDSDEKAIFDLFQLSEGTGFAAVSNCKFDLDKLREGNEIHGLVFDFHSSSFFRSAFPFCCELSYLTSGFRFYTQLAKSAHDAMTIRMQQCDVHFVCCVSPNIESDRFDFSSKYCADQLSLFVSLIAKFYSNYFVKHYSGSDFLKEFRSILPDPHFPLSSALPALLSAFNIESEEIVFGKSSDLIFLRSQAIRVLNHLRFQRENFAAKIIQRRLRQNVRNRYQSRAFTPKQASLSPKSFRNASFQDLSQLRTHYEGKSAPKTKSLSSFLSADNEQLLSIHICKNLESLTLFCNDTKTDPAKLCSSQLLLAIRQNAPVTAKLWLQRCYDIDHDIGEVRLEHAERFITSAAFTLVDEICRNGGRIQFQSSLPVKNRKIRDPFSTDFSLVATMVQGINQFKNFSLLRKPRTWARPKNFISLSKAPSMLSYQDVPMHKTLIKVESWRLHGSEQSSHLKRDALEIFTDLLGFIKARPQVCPEALANEICKKGRNQVLLRDEIYCQILKQSNCPPNREIEALVWKMLLICLLSFQPMTEDLGRIVFSHICSRLSSPVIIERYHILDTVEDIAANCFKAFLNMHKSSMKLPAITIQRIQQINHSVKYSFRCYIFCVDRHLELERDAIRCPRLPSGRKDEIGLNGLKRSSFVDIEMPGFEDVILADDLIDWVIARSDLVKRIGTVSDQLFIAIQDQPGRHIQRTGIAKSVNVSELLATVSYRCSKQRLVYWLELYPGPPVEDPDWDVSITKTSLVEDSKQDFSEID